MRTKYIFILILCFNASIAQNKIPEAKQFLSFKEYLGYVKKHHPLIKQANLKLSIGEASLLKSRGGFDPKIEIDYDRKKFKGTEYFDQLNTIFKIPTWFGVEFKANFEQNSGVYLNPNLTVPDDGLYSAGVSFSLAQGLLINDRMATLKKAKVFIKQTKADKEMMINDLIYKASLAYFKWFEASKELVIYTRFLDNAKIRFRGVKRNVELGEKAAIDSVEATITLKNRKLNLEIAKLKTRKAMFEASNYLWVNSVPLEIQENIMPKKPTEETLSNSFFFKNRTEEQNVLVNHPKIRSLEAKIDEIDIDRYLKKNKLLPKIDLQYNFLSSDVNQLNTFKTANYKAFLNFSFPLFLRKERGDLKLAKLKLQEANFKLISTSLKIQNKINAIASELYSLEKQNTLIDTIVTDYSLMLSAEERKFQLGESSLFLINSREQKLISAELKANSLMVKRLKANASLYNAYGFYSVDD